METLERSPEERAPGSTYAAEHDDVEGHALARRGSGSLVAKGALALAALFGLALFIRELPDLRRYLRIERM